ncbi:hypothetical protein X740_29155, partial [Mesorhizobium sp. LNHC221B00]
MNRLADRVLAFLLAAVAIGCLARIYPLVATLAWGRASVSQDAASLRLLVFSVAGLACLVGALLLWAGLLPGRPAHLAGAPLFGRTAEARETGRPGLRKVFFALPLVVLAALGVDQFGPWHDGGEVASEPKADEPKPDEPKSQDVASTPPAVEPAPPAPPPVAANPPSTPVPPAPPQMPAAPPPE